MNISGTRSICPCLHSLADCENHSCKHCSITSCKSTCWSLFSFPGLKISCLQRTFFSGDRSQHVKLVRLTEEVKCEDQFQCLSAYQPYQPLKKTCINPCHTCPWLCQHCVGVEVVSPEKSSESDEHLLFTRSKPKRGTL